MELLTPQQEKWLACTNDEQSFQARRQVCKRRTGDNLLCFETYLEGEGADNGADSGSSQPSAADAEVPQPDSAGGLPALSVARAVPERCDNMKQI